MPRDCPEVISARIPANGKKHRLICIRESGHAGWHVTSSPRWLTWHEEHEAIPITRDMSVATLVPAGELADDADPTSEGEE